MNLVVREVVGRVGRKIVVLRCIWMWALSQIECCGELPMLR